MILVTLIVLNVVAALLPLIGLTSLAVTAHREFQRARASGPVPGSVAALTAVMHDAPRAPERTWRLVRRDLALVGAGIVAGAVANVWSLFV